MDALGFTLLTGLTGALGQTLWKNRFRSDREGLRRSAREERKRKEGCNRVLTGFLNVAGYASGEVIDPGTLRELIAEGITPADLSKLLRQLWEALPGSFIGHHGVGASTIAVKLPLGLRLRHMLIQGKTGQGKTTLIRNFILSDLAVGRGVGVIGPEAELFRDELLPFIPESRWEDVIYFNPADTTPIPFNPLHLDPGEDLDRKVDENFVALRRICEEDGAGASPRTDMIARHGLYVLTQIGGTLADFPRLLDRQDASFREWALAQIADEQARHFWMSIYPSMPRDAHLPLVNRIDRFLRPKVIRNLLCIPGRSFNFREAMDAGRIVLCNLSDGLLGESNAQLLGQLLIAKLQLAAMSRADLSPERRRPFFLYVDEVQNFVASAGGSYEKLTSRGRKYGLSLTMASQNLGQIPEHTLREILGNVASVVAFRTGATDARRLSREFVGEVNGQPVPIDAKEFLSLQTGEAYCKIGRTVLFVCTAPPPTGGSARTAEEIIRRSRLRYGISTAETRPQLRLVRGQLPEPADNLDPGTVF